MTDELETIKKISAYIEQRKAEGATDDELEKHYEDLLSIQTNYYLGELLGDDDE